MTIDGSSLRDAAQHYDSFNRALIEAVPALAMRFAPDHWPGPGHFLNREFATFLHRAVDQRDVASLSVTGQLLERLLQEESTWADGLISVEVVPIILEHQTTLDALWPALGPATRQLVRLGWIRDARGGRPPDLAPGTSPGLRTKDDE